MNLASVGFVCLSASPARRRMKSGKISARVPPGEPKCAAETTLEHLRVRSAVSILSSYAISLERRRPRDRRALSHASSALLAYSGGKPSIAKRTWSLFALPKVRSAARIWGAVALAFCMLGRQNGRPEDKATTGDENVGSTGGVFTRGVLLRKLCPDQFQYFASNTRRERRSTARCCHCERARRASSRIANGRDFPSPQQADCEGL